MSKHNRGFTGAHVGASLITIFGTCLFGLAVLLVPVLLVFLLARPLVLPASEGSAGPLLSPKGSPTATGDTCSQVVSNPDASIPIGTLNGVAVISANDVWAVGYSDNTRVRRTLVEHWNGTTWSVVPSPDYGVNYNELNGVAAVSANDVWAVGGPGALVEHWDGTAWSMAPSPNPGSSGNHLYGVAAVSANDLWAVGYSDNRTLVEHWDGTAWSVIPSPNMGADDNLYGVAAVSANDVWAVGLYYLSLPNGPTQTLVEHWDGTAWSIVPSPNPGSSGNHQY